MEEGRKPEYPEKTPDDEPQKTPEIDPVQSPMQTCGTGLG